MSTLFYSITIKLLPKTHHLLRATSHQNYSTKILNMSTTHLAAILPSKGTPLEVVSRPTPKPGPHELLVEVHSLALNPIDVGQRDSGFMLAGFPSVLGSDIGGIVISAGSSVAPSVPKPGSRVAAFANTFYAQGSPDYGAYQKLALLPASHVAPIPDSLSFNDAALLGMAVVTAFSGLYSVGLPRDTHFKPADKQGMLVWGGASSVGSAVVQIAKGIGFTVFVAASEKHSSYLKSLGASRVFDYKKPSVISDIVSAAKADGVQINWGYDSVGALDHSTKVLAEAKTVEMAKLASAVGFRNIPGWEDGFSNGKKVPGVEVKFVMAPNDETERTEHFQFIMNWLKEKLERGEFVPSPRLRVVGKGLESLNAGLDELKKGVSGEKLVVEL